MNSRALVCISIATAALLSSCAPIRTETVSVHHARSLLNNTVDFGWDGGVVRPNLLRSMGVELMIHRATRGGTQSDVDYARRERAARVAGLKWGAYHYVNRAGNLQPQLDRFIREVAGTARRNGTTAHPLLMVLDNEGRDRVSWSQLAWAAQHVRAHTGVWPLLYCSVPLPGMPTFAQQERELEALTSAQRAVLKACGLWIPRYGEQTSTHMTFSVPRVFGTWTFWQYCGDISGHPKTALFGPEFSGNVGGAYTRSGGRASLRHFCDRSFFNGSHAAFEKYYRSHSSAVVAWR
ncbi:GH25 family lysozyme [Prosthecobacter sp.]|uniref:GH25 family lysozyme n=1 Tax=Prosthecobacter sp. TaxID=1965333 RepID=UPI00248A36CE|nr:GH25 family lysozyme [Prosthecobacter sp.]MDI1314043.1 GH25 family lysozyme [Prosthecobacter sp.]